RGSLRDYRNEGFAIEVAGTGRTDNEGKARCYVRHKCFGYACFRFTDQDKASILAKALVERRPVPFAQPSTTVTRCEGWFFLSRPRSYKVDWELAGNSFGDPSLTLARRDPRETYGRPFRSLNDAE